LTSKAYPFIVAKKIVEDFMLDPRIEIAPLDTQGMHIHLAWAKAEGWNPGLEDHKTFCLADKHGFLGCWLDGRVIATISAVKYADQFGFIGFYIVDPKFRGQGFGRKIWDAGLARLQGIRTGLDGVVAQQDFYRKSGFITAHRNIRWQGLAKVYPESSMQSPSNIHFASMQEYDARHFGCSRANFLYHWLRQEQAFVRVSMHDSTIQGYGVIRKCHSGYKIGPLFADNPGIAESILHALLSAVPEGSDFYLDIPENNPEARRLCEEHAMSPVFETARMYKGTKPCLPLSNIFGITSFELG